ncbi:MAG: hypothetical protein LBV68_03620 [Spirochaetaceae bacterium]|nr:hypothetical protein [Spirochaetaceae bacterium]
MNTNKIRIKKEFPVRPLFSRGLQAVLLFAVFCILNTPAIFSDEAGISVAEEINSENSPVHGDQNHEKKINSFRFFDYFSISLLETGSWGNQGNMSNRAQIILGAPLGLSFRSQILDKRPSPPQEDWSSGADTIGLGLYQRNSNSRILYGQLEHWGLAARTRNIWSHGAPWFETHTSFDADLKNSLAVNGKDSFYAALGSPLVQILKSSSAKPTGFAADAKLSILLDSEQNALYHGASDFHFGKDENSMNKLRFEAILTEKNLNERSQSTWFSDKPYLPHRKLRFYGLNVTFYNPYIGFSADFAHSEVFTLGEDIYINGSLRAGNSPWRFSLSFDGAGKHYISSDGTENNAGFRIGGKIEWFGSGNMRINSSTILRSTGIHEPFESSLSKIYYHFPIIKGYLITPSYVSFEFERDASNREKITDKISGAFCLNVGPIRPLLRLTLGENTKADAGTTIIPYPNPGDPHTRDFFKTDIEISAPVYLVTLKAAFSYKTENNKKNGMGASLSASIRGKLGRFSIKISSNEKTGSPDYFLSWKLEGLFK